MHECSASLTDDLCSVIRLALPPFAAPRLGGHSFTIVKRSWGLKRSSGHIDLARPSMTELGSQTYGTSEEKIDLSPIAPRIGALPLRAQRSRCIPKGKACNLTPEPYSLRPMRASRRIPRTKRIAKQANRVPDQNKTELPTWANFSVLIAGATVVAFLFSSLFVSSLTIALHFPVAVYIHFIDYIKLLPTAVTVTGPFWFQMLLILTAAAGYKLYILPIWQQTLRDEKQIKSSRLAKFARAIRMSLPFTTLVFQFLPILLVLNLLWSAFLFAGDQTVDGLRHARTLKVFRKGELHPVEGKLICPSSKYVLLLTDQDKSVAIIPQTEIQFIERPWNVPDVHPSPTVSHASASDSP